MKKAHRNRLVLLSGLVLFFLFCIQAGARKPLTVSRYTVLTGDNAFRVVHLTDLHNSEFGEQNKQLVDIVSDLEPDLMIKQLTALAPVYVSFGNHEMGHELRYRSDLKLLYEEAGAAVLDFTYEDLEIEGNAIRLGGFYGYGLPEKYLQTGEAIQRECDFLDDFQNTERFTILLAHIPYTWLALDGLEEWNVNCVFSGHVHGGQVRLPLIGGMWAPDQGWFPGREAGLYWSEDNTRVMVLSRGLGSDREWLPRLNNPPEIVCVDFLPAG